MEKKTEQTELLLDNEIIPQLLGVGDSNLRYMESHFTSDLTVRGSKISVRGPVDEMERIRKVFLDLEALYKKRSDVRISDIDTILRLAGFQNGLNGTSKTDEQALQISLPQLVIKARGLHQARYLRLMEKQTVVFASGPAGTGKTYLAVAMAVNLLQRKIVSKIILVRPVVESGETLGFLPGDILEKVDPYFRPLYDALDEMLTHERVKRLIENGQIEVAPLAYMRGRTLNGAFVILDEAQNTTSGQMKMFLTRLGISSKAVLTGDLTQVDLPASANPGLIEAHELLQGIDGIGFIEFDKKDVVRHKLVAEILRAYEGKR